MGWLHFRLAVGRNRDCRRESAATKRTRTGALICLPLAAFCRRETWSLPLLSHIKTPGHKWVDALLEVRQKYGQEYADKLI